MRTQGKACLGLAAVFAIGTLSGCFVSKKTEVVEEQNPPPRVSHEKTIETERPVIERERTVIERHD